MSLTRNLLRAMLPLPVYDGISFSLRSRRRLLTQEDRPTAVDQSFIQSHGPVVRRGPFTGMEYDPRVIPHTTAVAAKLVGAYESELHSAIEEILELDLSVFVDIGCAEGFYVVGVMRRRPDIDVIAFDIDATARHMCRLTARKNGVKPSIRREATLDFLAGLPDRAVVFCDAEGAEVMLLDPQKAPALARLPVLVEVHDFVRPGATDLLKLRFAPTHSVREIGMSQRDPDAFPELADVPPGDRDLAISEGRGEAVRWLVMFPTRPALQL